MGYMALTANVYTNMKSLLNLVIINGPYKFPICHKAPICFV